MVQLFIESGVNIKMKDRKGRTACERAMEGEHNDVVELLLKAGSDKTLKEINKNKYFLYKIPKYIYQVFYFTHPQKNRGLSVSGGQGARWILLECCSL